MKSVGPTTTAAQTYLKHGSPVWRATTTCWHLGLSNVQLTKGRKVMVSYDILDPGGRVTLHAQIPFVQSDVRRLLLSVEKLTNSSAEVKIRQQGLKGRSSHRQRATARACAREREDFWPLHSKDQRLDHPRSR